MLSVTVTLYPGQRKEGIMLAANQDSLRLALRGSVDTIELRRVQGQWLGDDNHPVDFEVLLTDGTADVDVFVETRPRVMTAGMPS